MAYKDKNMSREWQRRRRSSRRAAYMEGKSCARCGATEKLELDHIDPTSKHGGRTRSAVLWSWRRERLEAELAKCQVLCKGCHLRKSRLAGDLGNPGESNGRSKLTEADAKAILASNEGAQVLAEMYGVHPTQIYRILRGARWGYLQEGKAA